MISCEISSGNCTSGQCEPGYWKSDCFTFCSDTCGQDNNGHVTCDILTGRCDADCLAGYYGDTCNMVCKSKCYDDQCHREDGVCTECLKDNPSYICPDARKSKLLLSYI